MVSAFFLFCGCVDQASVAVVEKWGRFLRLAEPGLHFFNPFAGECVAGVLSTRVQSLDVRVETKTKDNVFVQLICTIQYRVVKEHADDAFYELQNPQQQIQAYVFDVARALVPRMNLDDLFEQKNDVAKAVLLELEKVMGDYGYSIEHILIVDIIPDAAACRAMNDINAGNRPFGWRTSPNPPVSITRDSANAVRAHVLEVASGCDVVDSVASYACRRRVGVCVVSGTGGVTNVSIRQPGVGSGAVVSLAGRFDILSLSGSFLPAPAPPPDSGLTVYVSGEQGQVVGGTVAGPLIAVGPVVIMAVSFGAAAYERLPLDGEEPPQHQLAGQSSPPPPQPQLPLPPHQQPNLADHLPHNLMDEIHLPGDVGNAWTSAGAGGGGAPY
ncbi:hypothetical protein ABZP36_010849 [Zizania latifolia]